MYLYKSACLGFQLPRATRQSITLHRRRSSYNTCINNQHSYRTTSSKLQTVSMNKIAAVKDAVMEKTHMGGNTHDTGVG